MRGKKYYLPFLLSFLVIVLDQATKAWIVANIEENTLGFAFIKDFLWIIHVRNTAVAFSLGTALPIWVKYIFFILLPLALMGAIAYALCSKKFEGEITTLQRYALSGILGGGIGNLIDRIFRDLRVVDWISVKFYGLFGLERFPTWNIADGTVVVSVFLLLITVLVDDYKKKKE